MSEFISYVRPVIELIYFITSSLLIVGLGLAYRQLILIKSDMYIKNKRASAEKAIEAGERYFCEYIPLTTQVYTDRLAEKIVGYSGDIGDFTTSSVPTEQLEKSEKRYSLDSWLPALNRLEAIAAYFTTGVADESVGFSIFGRTFCSSVESDYDMIALSRKSGTNDYWENIVILYNLWRPRLSKAELEQAKSEMEKKISALTTNKVSPIGM